jgi:HD superfamily phosphodiesterase
LIFYNSANGISALQKHVYVNYYTITKIFEKKVKKLFKKPYESQPAKKIPHVNETIISNFFCYQRFL